MSNNDLSLEAQVEIIASFIGDNFLRLAKALREIQDEQPDIFLKVVELVGISRRKAYALTRINRQFDDLGVPEERLYYIGWTKLQIVGRYLTNENAEYLLKLGERLTSHDLEARLRGEIPVKNARVVMLYLAPADYARLRTALLKHGAIPSGKGLIEKEAALMTLIDKAIAAQ